MDQQAHSFETRIPDVLELDPPGIVAPRPMMDGFGRRIDYVRISITDRCDLRCRYCMSERMRFEPSQKLLSFDEIEALADLLIERGVRRIRLSGGEPLVRHGAIDLIRRLGRRVHDGRPNELTLTTNGTRLEGCAADIAGAGVRRLNVSLDSRNPERFRHITRVGELDQVLRGIAAAKSVGLKIRINMVVLAGFNEEEVAAMLAWCVGEGFDLALIEAMPLGDVGEDRSSHYVPLEQVAKGLRPRFLLSPSAHRTGGPARYFDVVGTGSRLGLISPLSRNFCDSCNRIRISATGTVYGCLGHDQKVELRNLLRSGGVGAVDAALDELLALKPRRHLFDLSRPATARHMNVTGG